MKVCELRGGVTTSLTIRPVAEDFDPIPDVDAEIALVRSGDQTFLTFGTTVCEVEGEGARNNSVLAEVVASGLPVLVFVAQAGSKRLVLSSRRFPSELRIVEPMRFGLDDKVMDDVRRGHRVGGTAEGVAAWLEDQLFLPAAPEGPPDLRRMLISGDSRGRLDVFRIYGRKVAADIRRVQEKLRIERVVRGGQNNSPRLTLLYAPVSIVDATAAAELHGEVRTSLSDAVGGKGSYMGVWQDYQEREQEIVRRRARAFGVITYSRCERRRDGGWRFHFDQADDLEVRLAALGEWQRFELQAAERAPSFEETTDDPPAGRSRARTPTLSAQITDFDGRNSRMDLAAPGPEEDQPRPPTSGFLCLSTAGDEVRLRRRQAAEESLRTGACPLPQLGLLMEDRASPATRRTRHSVEGPKLKAEIRKTFGDARPTQRQLEAIERALNTPDLCLIQGPPGTGKTKVITAIQRCLAVLADEGVEPSHRVLATAAQHDAVDNVVQRTEVFGLPAVKIGRRRGSSDSNFDSVESFRADRAEMLRARMKTPPEAERLGQARSLVLSCLGMRSLPAEQARRIRKLAVVVDGLVPPELHDAVLARAAELERPSGLGDIEDHEALIRAARGIRVDAGPFSDDGPLKARMALRRLDGVLTDDERTFLERSASCEPEPAPTWLEDGRSLRDALLDRLTAPAPSIEPRLDDETERLLVEVIDAVNRGLAAARAGEDYAIADYLDALDTDPEAVRNALEHYTVVLAATLQQSASKAMRGVLGIDIGQTTFESVIVDEAARANPLDLFIPLSMAKRRAVLVGDHRQLPHLLEPDVERQLQEGFEQGTVQEQTLRNVQASLFERLWLVLRSLENEDGIRRTATLNVQYRMHPVLGAFISREFYELHQDAAIESPRPPEEFSHNLPGYTRDEAPCAAAWIDVPNARGKEVRGVSKYRPAEARMIAKEVRRLIDEDSQLTFAVIAFYKAQVDEVGRAMIEVGLTESTDSGGWAVAEQWQETNDHLGARVERLRIGTVDAFQGKEFDVVFLSVTRSNDLLGETDQQQRRKYGHLMLDNRLCVAMSRQKRLLVAVGDLEFVQSDVARKPLRALHAFSELCGGEYGVVR